MARIGLKEPDERLLDCALIMLTCRSPHPPSVKWASEFVIDLLTRECNEEVQKKINEKSWRLDEWKNNSKDFRYVAEKISNKISRGLQKTVILQHTSMANECSYLEWFFYNVDKKTRMELQAKYQEITGENVPPCFDVLDDELDTIPQKDPPSTEDYLNDDGYKSIVENDQSSIKE